jgi:chromosome segregation ATPase
VDDRAVNELRALDERDRALSERAARLRDVDAEAAGLRARAEAIEAFFSRYPDEESARRAGIDGAERELERRRGELDEARRLVTEARSDDERAHAEKAVARGLDHVAVAESALLRARSAYDELEREAAQLPAELAQLDRRAGVSGARELVDWSSRTHAEHFVELGQIDAQRERFIREANELATMLLGEPTYGSTVAQLAQRVLPLAGE